MNNTRYFGGGVHLPITTERRQGTLILVSVTSVKGGQRRKEVILRG